jgi:hypothetical protein
LRRERRSGGKTDALDAVCAARSALAQERPATPRAGAERQALQALVAAGEGAVNAKRAGLCQLRDLLDQDTGAVAERAAAADTCTASATSRSDRTAGPTRRRAARQPARAALDRSTGAAADRGGASARPRDRNDHPQARTAAARPTRHRSARRRSAPPLLGPPRPNRSASCVREARRHSADPRLLRPNDPLPPRPKQRPQTQAGAAHDPPHTETLTPRHDRLTSNGTYRRAKPNARQTAAPSTTSPAASTGSSNTEHHQRPVQPTLTFMRRSITGATEAPVYPPRHR